MTKQPFHDGEIAVQERAGERDFARRHGAGISSQIVPGALSFLAQQRLLALSAAGDDGRLWTSVWYGEAGFVQSSDGHRVNIHLPSATASPEDPVRTRLLAGSSVGMLAIDLSSRRRLRINGVVEYISDGHIDVAVRESVGNCPKYVQRRRPRELSAKPARQSGSFYKSGRTLDGKRQTLLERADTAFVGSLHPARGVDTSHRGGAPGFIQVIDETTLRVPDYPGNSMFMTLGNFEVDPRASVAVVDFERGQAVAFTGSAKLHFGADDPRLPTGGTGRYWDFSVHEWVQFELPSMPSWELLDASPFNPPASGQ